MQIIESQYHPQPRTILRFTNGKDNALPSLIITVKEQTFALEDTLSAPDAWGHDRASTRARRCRLERAEK